MIEKPKRPKKISNQDNKQPQTIQELIRRYDLDNTKIYDYLDTLVLQINSQYKQTLENIYPIGSIYMSVNNTNPSNWLGGMWEEWGRGRVPVGVDAAQTEFSTVEQTGGEKTHTLTIDEMPKHSHSVYAQTMTGDGANGYGIGNTGNISFNSTMAGGSKPHNNLQPYITCYMWKRIA